MLVLGYVMNRCHLSVVLLTQFNHYLTNRPNHPKMTQIFLRCIEIYFILSLKFKTPDKVSYRCAQLIRAR